MFLWPRHESPRFFPFLCTLPQYEHGPRPRILPFLPDALGPAKTYLPSIRSNSEYHTSVALATRPDEEVLLTKLLFHGNAPWVNTGYGMQLALFAPRLRDAGYDVAISAFFGLHGRQTAWRDKETDEPITVFPGGAEVYGNDIMGAHFKYFVGDSTEPALFISLTDVWVLKAPIIAKLPVLAWCPVDHEPAPSVVTSWFNESGAVPLAMSRFGQEQLQSAGFETLYVPHGVDTSVFSPGSQALARKKLRLPGDKFVVGIVAANKGRPGRKGWTEMLQAYAKFSSNKPDTDLYMHTQLHAPDGEPLMDLVRSLGIKPYAVDQYGYVRGLPATEVADVYRAMDVLLNTSHGEGFGITPLEAQACGTPVIATNFSAMREVVGKGCGWLVNGQFNWTQFDSWQMTPAVPKIVRALDEAYEEWQSGISREDACVAHAAAYEVQHVVDTYWQPAITEALDIIRWRDSQTRVVRR